MTADTSHTSFQGALRDASWIPPGETSSPEAGNRPAHWIRGSFACPPETQDADNSADRRAVVHATAHGIYQLFVNAPAWAMTN